MDFSELPLMDDAAAKAVSDAKNGTDHLISAIANPQRFDFFSILYVANYSSIYHGRFVSVRCGFVLNICFPCNPCNCHGIFYSASC